MISNLSKYIAKTLYKNLDEKTITGLNDKKFSIIELENRLKILLIYLFMVPPLWVAGYIFDIYSEIIIVVISLIMIRIWNGGHHFKPDLCVLVTLSAILIVPLINHYLMDYISLIFGVATIINLIFAPYSNVNIKLNPNLMKVVSVLVCILAYLTHSNLVLITLFVLAFDLIKRR